MDLLSHDTVNKGIRVAQLLMGWCCLLMYAFMVVCQMPFYAENRALAVGSALSRAQVRPADLDAVLDAVSAVRRLVAVDELGAEQAEAASGAAPAYSTEDMRADVHALYVAMGWFARQDSRRMADVGVAWQYPRLVPKTPIGAARYAPLRDKMQLVFDGWEQEDMLAQLSPQAWQQTAPPLRKLAQNAAELPEDTLAAAVDALRRMAVAEHPTEVLSVKDWRAIIEVALRLVADVDFADMYFLDVLWGEGLCRAIGADAESVCRALAHLSYDRVTDAMMLLPNRTRAVHALVRHVFGEVGVDVAACCRLANALHTYGLAPALPTSVVEAEITYLTASPAAPNEEEWQQIATHVDALLAPFMG